MLEEALDDQVGDIVITAPYPYLARTLWGDPERVFRANDIQGLNTGVFLLRKCEWSRQLMAEVAALATPSIRRYVGNKGRIAEQGALTWVLHSQAKKWRKQVLFERNFTMNGGAPSHHAPSSPMLSTRSHT